MKSGRRISVFCGSSAGRDPAFSALGRAFGEALAARGHGLVYGGAKIGVMGAVADGALAGGAEVIGVLPHFLAGKEIAHAGLSELHLVDTMHERKAKMVELSDAFVALPGGFGTLDELFEVLTWAQLGLHGKPCAILDYAGFFAGIEAFVERAASDGFLRPEHRGLLLFGTRADDVLDAIERYVAPVVEKLVSPEQL
ncbi:MAG: TIGR00730 family Rossman fold protein [Polyangiaceae bacterium]|nr:TIGR00730 family Rossman fold protein [Polyangiaceae bacterium]MBK8939253.1 TIGR00730 family Rossman fold protein [Polyangiaceae bacterium]